MGDDERQRVRLRDILRIDVPKLHAANTNAGVDATPAARIIMRILEEPRGRYMTRVLYCPPLPLLWGFLPGDGTEASVVHKAYVRALWTSSTPIPTPWSATRALSASGFVTPGLRSTVTSCGSACWPA